MLTLTCPFCGVTADETELAPGGEAHLKRFGPGSTDGDFEGYLFGRRNPKGVHFERWRHVYGCGRWFLAARDTVTLQVFGTYAPQCDGPPPALIAAIQAVRPGWRHPTEPLDDDSTPGIQRDPAQNPTPSRDTIA